MPTKIATIGRERTITTLARRLYKIDGQGRADVLRRAEAALIAANPRLSNATGFRSGMQIVVPAVSGVAHTEEVHRAKSDDKGLTSETTARLQALGSRIDDSFTQAAQDHEQLLKQFGDRSFVAQARRALPESAEHMTRTKERLRKEQVQAEKAKEQMQKAVSSAIESLKMLDELARKAVRR